MKKLMLVIPETTFVKANMRGSHTGAMKSSICDFKDCACDPKYATRPSREATFSTKTQICDSVESQIVCVSPQIINECVFSPLETI